MHTFDITTNSFVNPIIDWLNNTLPRLPGAIFGLLVGIIFVRLLVHLTRWLLTLTQLQKGLRQLIVSTISTILWLFLSVQVLKALGFADVLVFFSSSALALGILLAAGGTTLLSDLVAGVFLVRDGDFNVGDEVKAGESGVEGVIESMDMRRVRIRDKDGLLHVLPNSMVERKEWVVINRRQEITGLARAVKTAKTIKSRLRKNGQ